MGLWKERIRRLGEANEAARREHLRGLTRAKAVETLEGLLRHPPHLPSRHGQADSPISGSKVSLGRRLRHKK